jgi:inner membrane protein
MMSITHSMIAASGVSLILGTAEPLPLALGILGAQLPDLDTTQSFIGQMCYPISNWIEDRFPHRSVTHSLLATAVLALLSVGIGHFWLGAGWKMVLALPLGHLLSCFSDCFTKQGVQLFWPEPAWCVSVSNPKRRLTTGGAGELWVLAIASACLCLGIYLANGGGITSKVTQGLGLREGAITDYNQNAASRQIWAKIEGVYASDSSKADGKYFVVAVEGNEFIVANSHGIYKTGTNLTASKLTVEVGLPSSSSVQSLEFDEEPFAIEPVNNTLITVSGTLSVDDPALIKISINSRQFEIANLSADKITFTYCPLERAIKLLAGQYVTGSLEAKIFTPKPDL